MTIEETKPIVEVAKEVTTTEPMIEFDIFGTSISMPMSKAKELIGKRDSKTKEYNELKGKIEGAEKIAKQESEKSALLTAMKAQDIASVEEQVSAKYKDTISKFEQKVFKGEIKATLSNLGVIAEAMDDAMKLVLTDTKVELVDDVVTLNGIKVEEYLKTWVDKKPHLVTVKGITSTGAKLQGKTVIKAIEKNPYDTLSKGLSALMNPK